MEDRRLLFVNPVSRLGGAERSTLSLLIRLPREGFTATLVCPAEGLLPDMARRHGLEVIILPLTASRFASAPANLWGQAKELRSSTTNLVHLIKDGGYNLLHINSHKMGLPCTLAARMARIPIIWHIRDILVTTPLRRFALISLIKYLPDRVIAVSEACARQFAPSRKVRCIYNGIDVAQCRAEANGARIREEMGLSPNTPLIGCVGQLIPWKGQDYFLRAAACLIKTMPQAKFLIVGEDTTPEQDFAPRLKQLSAELGLFSHTIFTGFRQDAISLIDSMDILIHPPIQPDPLPRALLEGMALSKPIVASRVGGIPEMITDGETGLLVPPKDGTALAEAMVRLLNDPQRAQEMGRRGEERVRQLFSIEKHVRSMADIYHDLLGP
ncbi:MAG: glycosyltransferase family 4 protein [Chloroflexi bacterium]|nr:glycosyltransferase family 4 protein [Chloroflexota bacterium]